MSSKFSGFLVALKTKTPYLRAFPGLFHYSSSSRVTTYCVTRFAVLQDIGNILSGIEGNNHIISVFLSQIYPWDKKHSADVYSCFTGIIPHFIWSLFGHLFGHYWIKHEFICKLCINSHDLPSYPSLFKRVRMLVEICTYCHC